MIYGSVCSGIEAATAAWHPLGWKPAFFSEIEKFPRAVLAHRYPDVPCHGDFTTIKEREYGAINLLVGGTPCQDFSVAGLRAGITGARGGLTLEFVRLAAREKPRWVVWENVPGVLSIDRGRAFGAFLAGLGQCGYGFAYRVLDAQHFGIPQRRRRVFVIGYLGDWRPAAAVLFEREGLLRDITPSRQARQGAARSVTASTGGLSAKEQQHTFVGSDGSPLNPLLAHTLRAEHDASEDGSGRGIPLVPDVAWALQERDAKGSDSNTKNGHLIPVAFDWYASQSQNMPVSEECPPLKGSMQPAVASFKPGQSAAARGIGYEENIAPSLEGGGGGNNKPALMHGMAVRRLTPRECERLQGFEDDFTLVPFRGKPAADGPRYKALGNSMAVPVMAWLGERIQSVDSLINPAAPK